MKNKIKIIIFISTILIGLTIGASTYFIKKYQENNFELFNSKNNNGSIPKNKINQIYDKINIFPKLNNRNFYKYIHVNNGQPILNDNFIAKVIKYVIMNIKIAGGTIKYGISDRTQNSFKIHFSWRDYNNSYYKTYTFNALIKE